MNSRNQFVGNPNIKLRSNSDLSKDIKDMPKTTISFSDKVMTKGDISVRFVHVGQRFTGELQFKINNPDKNMVLVWYQSLEEILNNNERITFLPFDQREIVEYPISVNMDEEESYEDIINDMWNVINKYKPEPKPE